MGAYRVSVFVECGWVLIEYLYLYGGVFLKEDLSILYFFALLGEMLEKQKGLWWRQF